jgi:hypothetical protein
MFYVYKHIRPDTGMVFYVGKGSFYRLNSRKDRNKHWHNIVNKVGSFKSKVIFEHQDEELVFLVEKEKIDQLRKLGVSICNVTNGGEGISGFNHTLESRKKMSESRKLLIHPKHTEESKEKIRQANTGVIFTEERKNKIRLKAIGRKMAEETKAKIREKNKKYKHSAETLAKMCEIQRSMPKYQCKHCSFVGNVGNLSRWHNDKCKLKGVNHG